MTTTRHCARAGQYTCWSPIVWAVTTRARSTWEFACARHLNQVVTAMTDQACVELIPANRITEDHGIVFNELALVREVIRTGNGPWRPGYLQSVLDDCGLHDITAARAAELLETLERERFVTCTTPGTHSPSYVLTSTYDRTNRSAEQAAECASNG